MAHSLPFNVRSLRHIAFVVILTALFASPASAQLVADPPSREELSLRVDHARWPQFLAGVGGAVLGTTGTVMAFALTKRAQCDFADEELCGIGPQLRNAALTELVVLPMLTAGLVTGVGTLRGIDGAFAMAWLGALTGTVGGLALGIETGVATGSVGVGFLAAPLFSVSLAAAGAVLGHNASARWRLERVLRQAKPSMALTSDHAGALFTVSGSF